MVTASSPGLAGSRPNWASAPDDDVAAEHGAKTGSHYPKMTVPAQPMTPARILTGEEHEANTCAEAAERRGLTDVDASKRIKVQAFAWQFKSGFY